jgi:MarR family transcriptional regulator, organic hydroperoxide resistance regulator
VKGSYGMDKEQAITTFWRQLMDLNRQIKQALQIMNAKMNISNSAMAVIFKLECKPSMKMNDIAEYLGITLGAATSLVDKLESQTWVERVRSTEDRRIIYVRLTKDGQDKLQTMRTFFRGQAQLIFEQIAPEKLPEMGSQLKDIESYLELYNRSFCEKRTIAPEK